MKLVKLLVQPYTVVIAFLMILVSGEQMGGFYMLYLLLGLPHGAIHAVLGVTGVILILANRIFRSLKSLIKMGGTALMILSLYCFFLNDKQHYNYATFRQTLPLISLFLFGIIVSFFIIANINLKKFHKYPI